MKYTHKKFFLAAVLWYGSLGLASPEEIVCQLCPIAKSYDGVGKKRVRKTNPHIPHRQGTSINWAGYAVTPSAILPIADAVEAVSGSWTVPVVGSESNNTYCSVWIGIDGFNSNSVEQIGTEHDWSSGTQEHYAWFEMYPEYPYEIVGFPVNPGDEISASVKYVGNGVFSMSITNVTRNVVSHIPTTYTQSTTAQRSSAEWILEAPYANAVLPLSRVTPVTFSNCQTTIRGVTGSIIQSNWVNEALTMVSSSDQIKATTSALLQNGQGFVVTWCHE